MKYARTLLLIAISTSVALSTHGQTAKTPPAGVTKPTSITSGKRDPFWPVGYYPNAQKPVAPVKKGLTEAELRALALAEQERLKRMLAVNGVMTKGGKNIAIISGTMVSTGDILEIDVGGNTYKLLIKSLTPDNIQLEPVRD